jgi:hypothetical protein
MVMENVGSQSSVVECDRHGQRPKAYVCDHLLHGVKQGFVTSGNQPENPYPDAWCLACDRIRLAHGGDWNNESEALITIRVVCGDCYEEIRDRNLPGTEHRVLH